MYFVENCCAGVCIGFLSGFNKGVLFSNYLQACSLYYTYICITERYTIMTSQNNIALVTIYAIIFTFYANNTCLIVKNQLII